MNGLIQFIKINLNEDGSKIKIKSVQKVDNINNLA